MLEELRIRGLGVIEDAALDLAPGLTVVTGETGAGKTMVIQGLALLFGGRADPSRVRPGSGRAIVEGRLVLAADHAAMRRAADAGADLDAGALLLTRTVGEDGRSRAFAGGQSVPAGVLAELADLVLAVHGQSDQQRLLRPAEQRAALDRFGGPAVLEARDAYRTTWARWREARTALAELREAAAQRSAEAGRLRAELADIEAAEPLAGETAVLSAEIERLANADDLRIAAGLARVQLTGDEDRPDDVDSLALVSGARRALEAVVSHDVSLSGLVERLSEAGHLIVDVAGDLASYLARVDADPARLAAAQSRLALLTALCRRLQAADSDELLAWSRAAGVRLREIDGTDERVEALAAETAELENRLGRQALALSEARLGAADVFARAVSRELADLAMPHARVSATVSQRLDAQGLQVGDRRLAAGPDGADEVELALAAHPGAPFLPLHKGASGGELSRVMLAIEVVFAGSDPLPLMVFDEVDAGVGGRAAVEVGRRLARLARNHQVLVVTHLPQVAAFADRHLLVEKSDEGSVTSSGVVALDDAARVAELSRMMAGLDSGLARGHAEELLAAAAKEKAVGVGRRAS